MEDAQPVLPVVQGDWVARNSGGGFEVARVRQSYLDDGQVYVDLVPYSLEGEAIGRQSPSLDGPKSYEPWCQFTDNGWQRIERPEFPLVREMVERPTTEGRVALVLSIFHTERGSVKLKPVRTVRRKQSQDYPSTKVRVIQVSTDPSNHLNAEIAAIRRAAQELRDAARTLGGEAASAVLQRASALEAEAAKLGETL
jgi:hypothetical protein